MKHILFYLLLSFLSLAGSAQSLHALSFTDIDGTARPLSAYSGSRLLVVVLPAATDTAFATELSAFKAKYGSLVKIIGVLSLEDGHSTEVKAAIKKAYLQDRAIDMALTGPLSTRKASAGQAPLLQWLTRKEQNTHFDMDVRGAYHKFFIDTTGELYAVLPVPLPLLSDPMEKIVRRITEQPTIPNQQ